MSIIEEQSGRLARLVNDVLTLSRLQRGNLAYDPQTIQICPVLKRVTALFPGTDLTIRCDEGLRAHCDIDHLEQILVNYISNAIKYGRPPFTAEARYESGGVQIEITDHGPGILPNFRSQLFKRFTQAAARPEGSGTGLGLSIVTELASAQGGRAWYEPNTPEGSKFVVWIPAREADVVLTPSGNR